MQKNNRRSRHVAADIGHELYAVRSGVTGTCDGRLQIIRLDEARGG